VSGEVKLETTVSSGDFEPIMLMAGDLIEEVEVFTGK
jgi:hypothetical protein